MHKEQYCIGIWNVGSMNQGKLEVVKQEMKRVSVDILGIRELRWTGMGEFNADDHFIYYCGQESLRRNEVAIMVNKRVQNAVLWMQSQKRQNGLCSFPVFLPGESQGRGSLVGCRLWGCRVGHN